MHHMTTSARRLATLISGGVLAIMLTGCGTSDSVQVLYAGSLSAVMEDGLAPAFEDDTSTEFHGEAHGSLGAAQLIRDKLRSPDVFVSADPAVNESILMGPDNGDLVSWYLTFASSQLVIAYAPDGEFADEFEAAEAGASTWIDTLELPGLRFGRGDPRIDPKGYRTLFMFDLAARHYHDDSIPDLLGEDLNAEQVYPEVALLARVDSGQLDAGIFYRHEAVAAGLPYVALPPEVNLGDPELADLYRQVSYTTPEGGVIDGAPILFTLTIPTTVKNVGAAESFIRFVLDSPDRLTALGFGVVAASIQGDDASAPAWLHDAVESGAPG